MWKLGAISFALTGCSLMPMSNQLSAEQMQALVNNKNFTVVCTTVVGIGGSGRFVYANVDQSVVINGSIQVDPNCVVTMSNEATITHMRAPMPLPLVPLPIVPLPIVPLPTP